MLYVLISLAALVLIFLIVVATRPAEYRVARSITIKAPAAKVFAQVNDLHLWKAWSPWAKLDPNMKETHAGPPAGVGATYHWVGNKKVGEGRMTITQSNPPQLVAIKLEFIKPFAATSVSEFKFEAENQETNVMWKMTGHNGFIAKAFCMFMNMDKMIGGDFEKGLAAMKAAAERTASTKP